MENVMKVLGNVFKLVCLIVCISLVIIGQKSIGYIGLLTMLIGLSGILLLLYFYNRQYK